MRLNKTLNNVFRDAGLSSMSTRDIDKLAEYSTGNFKDFKYDKPIQGFAGGGSPRVTGQGSSNTSSTPKYKKNYKSAIGGGSFLDTVSDYAQKAYDYANQAHDYATDSWLYRQAETGYNWIRGETGQKVIDNLIDRYASGKLTGGGGGGGGGQQQMRTFKSGAAESGGVNVASYRAGNNTQGSTPLTKTLAHAVANPTINPYAAAYVASQGVKVNALNLPNIDTPISMRNKTIMQQQAPTTTMTG
tara:strand:- start:1865 stop:2599 length:735 start_codon:yes stop_codon:yes gene_type:complete